MPWDLAIAERLHGGRDATAFVAHLTLGREWARQLLQESGRDEAVLAAELGQPGASLARLLDQYCYVRFTLDRRTTPYVGSTVKSKVGGPGAGGRLRAGAQCVESHAAR